MTTLVIPNFDNRVSPRLDYAQSLQLVTIEKKKIVTRETIKLLVHSNLERLNIITRLKPNILICDGISDFSKERLTENNIKIISWVHGEIDTILKKYLSGNLKKQKVEKHSAAKLQRTKIK
jgi:predicted Fe-Mo cluster-binding NifX family protein